MDEDAKSVLIRHQRHVTRQRIGVLGLLMEQKRAFTLKQIADVLLEASIDRITVYRALKSFLTDGIIGKAINSKGTACFFFLDHLKENRLTQVYLECTECEQLYGLPELPQEYLNTLNKYKTTLMPILLEGLCQKNGCKN